MLVCFFKVTNERLFEKLEYVSSDLNNIYLLCRSILSKNKIDAKADAKLHSTSSGTNTPTAVISKLLTL